MAPKQYWILKSEPDSFSIDDLERVGTTAWDGVRNYQARNYLRAQRKGDRVLIYHSSCAEPGVVGIAEIARAAYPDDTAFDPSDKHYDPKSDPSDPTWYMPDVKFVSRLPRVVTLRELQGRPELEGLFLTRKGNRLSVMPASKEHFDFIVRLARARTRPRTSAIEQGAQVPFHHGPLARDDREVGAVTDRAVGNQAVRPADAFEGRTDAFDGPS